MHRQLFTRLALLVGFSAIVIVTGLNPTTVSALTPSGQTEMTLSPTKQRVDIVPGGKYDGSFSIFNSGSTPFSFKVYAAPYTVKSDLDYTPVFTQSIPRTQISRWVQFPQTTFSVEPGKSIEVPYHMDIPSSIPAGSQYAALFAETTEQKTGSVVTKKRVGMLLYVRPNGHTIDKGSAELSRPNPLIFNGTITSRTTLLNQGNTDFDGTVTFTRKTVLGGKDDTITQTRTVLPDSTRTVTLESQDQSLFAIYDVSQSATVLGKTTNQTTRVYVISPVILVGGSVLLIIILGGAIWRVVRNQKKPHLTTK